MISRRLWKTEKSSIVCRTESVYFAVLDPLAFRGKVYSATSNNMKLVHWPLMSGLLHLVQRGGDWAGPQPTQTPARCTKCNGPTY